MAQYAQRRNGLRLQRTFRVGLALYLSIATVLATLGSPARPAHAATYPGKIGVGLEGIGGRGLEFVDVAKTLRPFEAIGGGAVATDANGYPLADARTVFFDMRPTFAWQPPMDDPEAYQINVSGTYKLSFTGQADLSLGEDPTGITIANKSYNSATNTTTADVTLATGKALLIMNFSNTRRTAASATNTGIANVKLIRPGYPANTTQTFHTPFVASLERFSTIRFMDWLDTNHNPGYYGDPGNNALNWADRHVPSDATQLTYGKKYGVAWEYVVELANLTGKDIWINIPVAATDDYVRQLATFMKNNLTNPNAKIYLEHSNEVWNFGFGQYTYNKLAAVDEVNRGGSVLNNDGSTDQEVWARRRHAKRTRDIGQIFQTAFGAGTINTRLFPVMAHWTIFPNQYDEMLTWLNATYGAPRNYIHAIAGASYFNCGSVCTTGTVDQLIDALRASSDGARADRQAHSNTATKWGIKHFMYEGGPDSGGGDPANVGNRIRAHRDIRMKDLIIRDMDLNWFPVGGDLFMYFTLSSAYSRYGMWGMTDDITNLDRNYKYAAIRALLGDGTVTTPAAPTGLSATAGSQQVSLSWNSSAGAASYTVKRSTTSGGPYTTVATGVTGTSYTNTSLANATTYFYVVSAVNSAGESANSAQASATPTATPTGSGSITREYWSNVTGTTVASIPLTSAPSATDTLTSLEGPTNWADNYGTRIRGYITAPTSGSYTFWVASDDDSELWLSTNDQPGSRVRIASVSGWTNVREWNKYASQKSATITLTAGSRYYVEVLHKEAGGGDNIAVGWLRPGQSGTVPSEVVPGTQLSPFTASPPAAPTGLSATAGNAQVSLSWSASAGATSYNVKRTTGGNYVTIATGVTGTSYTDTGLANGTTYFYIVTAVSGAGESSPSSQVSATPTGSTGGTGLRGEYFNNLTLTAPAALTRTDAQVNFEWSGSPASPIAADNFSVRWSGRVQAPVTGSYTFATTSDDGVRLWVNGTQVINNWTDHGPTTDTAAPISLTAGQQYNITMEFYERTVGATAKLLWSYPGQAQVAIPQSQLYPGGGTTTYLSDLNWTSATNGHGPVEKDRSNGETGATDGRTITLNGTTYTKGLGAHATSTIIYNLGGSYTSFTSDVGVDDEVSGCGSVAFQVSLDGTLAYDSGAMNSTSATKSINLNVAGKNELKLVVTDAGDGNACDHGDWAGARLGS